MILEASTALQNIYLIIGIIASVTALGMTVWGIIQKVKAGNFKGLAADLAKAGKQTDDLLGHATSALNQIKVDTSGVENARAIVRKTLKNTGMDLEAAGLKALMDAKLKELGLDNKS